MHVTERNIVYITDKPLAIQDVDLSRIEFDGNSEYASRHIYETLASICNYAYYYDDIQEFCQNIRKHKNDIVFTTLYGAASANSKALIPAICEANNITYVGADSYSQMLCNDKYLSKRYAQGYGIVGTAILKNAMLFQ